MAYIYREVWQNLGFRWQQNIDWPGHIHDDIELVYVKQGQATGYCDGRAYALKSGDFFLTFPNQSHYFSQTTPGRYLVLIIKPSRLLYHQDIFSQGHPVSALYSGDDGHLESLLETALEAFDRYGQDPVVDGYLTAFFGLLLRNYQIQPDRVSKNSVLKILEYCAGHYREDICIENICRELGISRSHVSHTFNNRIRMSFNDYINSLRLSDAVKFLEQQEHTITWIAGLTGFPTIRTFNRVFKNRYGMTPSQYRKDAKKHSPLSFRGA